MQVQRNQRTGRGMNRVAPSAFLLAAFAPLLVLGQVRVPGARPAADAQPPTRTGLDGFDGKELLQGTTIQDDREALKKIADARRMEGLKDWARAAEFYQEVLGLRDKLIPVGKDSKGYIIQYTSVRLAVLKSLSAWPPEGITAYRNLYEATAATQLAAAKPDDAAALEDIFQSYFLTEPAKQAGLRLTDMYLESGEFSQAIRICDTLLGAHPNLQVERPAVLYRAGIAAHWLGDDAKAKARLAELQSKFADATGVLYGKDTLLAGALAEEIKLTVPSAMTLGGDSYPTIGGDASRSMISTADVQPGALVARIEYGGQRKWSRSPADQQARQAEETANATGQTLGVIPAVDRGEMFFHDETHIYAISLESGLPLPGWLQTYGADRKGRYTSGRATDNTPRTGQYTLTVTDNSVYAVMGTPGHNASAMMMQMQMGGVPQQGAAAAGGTSKLVCVDRASGRERWTMMPKQVPQAEFAFLDFSGAPLVLPDRVYSIARGSRDGSSDSCYVVCLDANTGKYLWSSFVASADNSAAMMGGGGGVGEDTTSHLAASGGRVFVVSNLGAVASLDAYSGAVAWLNLYPRDVATAQQGFMLARRGQIAVSSESHPWEPNAAIVSGEKLFILPSDGKYLMIYDASSGAEIKRIRMDPFEGASQLLAVMPDKLLVAGESSIYCIDWPNCKQGVESDAILWKSVSHTIMGRPFVSASAVFGISKTSDKPDSSEGFLSRMSLGGGTITMRYPAESHTWDDGEGPGNIVVTQDQVIIAGAKSVNIYADINLARAKLDKELKLAPTDPAARLRYAEVMFAANLLPEMLAQLDEATRLLGGRDTLRPGEARDRLFNDALTFAQKLARDKKPELVDTCGKLFDYAAISADSSQQQVSYRVSRARFNRDFTQPDQALKLYQEILASASLRNVMMMEDDGPATRAAAIAEREIGKTIDGKPALYVPYDQISADALAKASKSNNPDALLEVAEAFPNAKTAKLAMIAAANAYEAAKNPRLAIHVLGEASRRFRDNTDQQTILEGMARNKLAQGSPRAVAEAAGMLMHAAVRYPNTELAQPLRLPDGSSLTKMSFTQAATAVRKYVEASARPLPDLHLPAYDATAEDIKNPLAEQIDAVIENVSAVVVPPAELRETARFDRILVTTDAGLAAYPAGKNTPIWTNKDFPDGARALSWQGNSVLVWSATVIALLDGDSGVAKWKTELKNLGTAEIVESGNANAVATAPPSGNAGNQQDVQVMINGQVRVVGAGGVVQMRMMRNFNQVAVRSAQPAGTPEPESNTEGFAEVRPVGDRVQLTTSTGRIVSLAADNGHVAWQTRLSDRPIDQIVANEDFTAVRFIDNNGAQLVTLDTWGMQVVDRRTFPAITPAGTPGGVVNLALSDDGTLVWTLADRLCGKYLYDAGRDPSFEIVAGINPQQPQAPQLYAGGSRPGQLLIAGNKILAMRDFGHSVCIHSLTDGKPMQAVTPDGKSFSMPIPTTLGSYDWKANMQVVGDHIYISTGKSVRGVNIEHPQFQWIGSAQQAAFVEMLPVKGALLMIDKQGKGVHVNTYSVAPITTQEGDTVESGVLSGQQEVKGVTDASQWVPAEGGLYYLDADKKLHFMPGNTAQ